MVINCKYKENLFKLLYFIKIHFIFILQYKIIFIVFSILWEID
jgi:hypothetical protein